MTGVVRDERIVAKAPQAATVNFGGPATHTMAGMESRVEAPNRKRQAPDKRQFPNPNTGQERCPQHWSASAHRRERTWSLTVEDCLELGGCDLEVLHNAKCGFENRPRQPGGQKSWPCSFGFSFLACCFGRDVLKQ